ncbi:MAG: inorganic phosphate transporter [Oscillospiraceae bacterium]|nr:inorganic phosphate transporter [Oscillospiraceae bacterium]
MKKRLQGMLAGVLVGVILMSVLLVNGQSTETSVQMPIWLMLLCSVVMGIGTSIGGKKIIKSVGMDMVKLEKYQGFSADIAASIALFFSSTFGIPVSTTHAKTTSIMGVGAVRRISAINFGVVKEMGLAWILTFPGCGLIGFIMTKIFVAVF